MTQGKKTNANGSGASRSFEQKLWAAADKMRSYMDPAEYKHVVLGLRIAEQGRERWEPNLALLKGNA